MTKRTRSDSRTKNCTRGDCDSPLRARGLCATHYNQTHQPNRHGKRLVPCVMCGTEVIRRIDSSRLAGHCCSVECRRLRQFGTATNGETYDWNSDAVRRARANGCLVIDQIDRLTVMERDHWTCYLCGIDTSMMSDPFDPRSATVDHVVSLTNGGEHSMRNVRCCCLSCNASKANRDATHLMI